MTDDILKDLAARLHAAHQELADENNREDQRLIEEAARLAELAESAAQRIEARAVEVEAAEAAMLAYGLEKASEGAVKVPVAVSGLNVVVDAGLDDDVEVSVPIGVGTDPHLGNVRGQSFEFAADSNGIEPPADYLRTYSNGLDAHNEE